MTLYIWNNKTFVIPEDGFWFNLDTGRVVKHLDVTLCILKLYNVIGSWENLEKFKRVNTLNDDIEEIDNNFEYVCNSKRKKLQNSQTIVRKSRTINVKDTTEIPSLSLCGKLCKCKVVKVIDGDTLKCVIKNPYKKTSIFSKSELFTVVVRVYGLDSQEKDTREGEIAKNIVELELLLLDNIVWLLFDKREKYGRELALVYKDKKLSRLLCSSLFNKDNLAHVYLGGKKKEFS